MGGAGGECAICGNVVHEQMAARYHGDLVHAMCLVCKHCGLPFDDGVYRDQDGSPYHVDCHNKLFGKACSACTQPISGKFVKFDGAPYHSACFKCDRCDVPITAGLGFDKRGGRIMCQDCL